MIEMKLRELDFRIWDLTRKYTGSYSSNTITSTTGLYSQQDLIRIYQQASQKLVLLVLIVDLSLR